MRSRRDRRASDLIVGIRSADPAAMDRIGDEYDRWPGNLVIYDTFYEIGPLLFLFGLLTLAILLTVVRKLPVWSPILLVLGFVFITINLDLMPLGAAALLIAVLPLVTSRQPALREAALPAGRDQRQQ